MLTFTCRPGVAVLVLPVCSFVAYAGPSALDVAAIERITGLKGALNAQENVFKVTQPRTDVAVRVDGRAMEPFMGFTSWASFTPGKSAEAMVMGDLVLMEDEINPVMDELFASGLSVTALHNHFLHDEPRVFFMHFAGEGRTETLAQGVRNALDRVKAARLGTIERMRIEVPANSSIDATRIDALLLPDGATKGQSKDGMYKAVLGRTVQMTCGCEVGKEMGVNTWFALAGSMEAACCSGDFLTFAGELQPVLHALRKAGIEITAIHNHMEGERPAAIFLHYWGRGPAAELAKGAKAALVAQASAPGQAATSNEQSQSTRFTFDDAAAGSLPDGWQVGTTQPDGSSATWQVKADAAAASGTQVLALTSPNHKSATSFNLCWNDRIRFGDGEVEVKVRADRGAEDRGGGPIWRVIDANNYYVARYNPLEKNFRVYFVKDGKRRQLAGAGGLDIGSGQWYTIRISHVGAHIACWLNDRKLLEADDATLPNAGGVGVWTKADAASSFDDLIVSTGHDDHHDASRKIGAQPKDDDDDDDGR